MWEVILKSRKPGLLFQLNGSTMQLVRPIYQYMLRRSAEFRFLLLGKFRSYPIPESGMFPEITVDYITSKVTGKTLLEFGSGGSTRYFSEYALSVTSIESDKNFARNVARQCAGISNVEVIYSNIGPTKSYGQPITFLRPFMKTKYLQYPLLPWSLGVEKYDVILVDGRFRVSCAMQSVINNPKPFLLIIDDYADRSEYGAIQEALNSHPLIVGKTAFFQIEQNVNISNCQETYEEFKYETA